jgi:hypothetical protein
MFGTKVAEKNGHVLYSIHFLLKSYVLRDNKTKGTHIQQPPWPPECNTGKKKHTKEGL